MTQSGEPKKLNNREYYKCPLPHVHPRHEQAFFKNFESHFITFSSREDHFEILQLHEELNWKIRCTEAEKRNLTEEDLQRISLNTWFGAVKEKTGKTVQIVNRK
jgi:hypothetical protein